MANTLRSFTLYGTSRGFTLDDLRTLVRETDGLPADKVVSVVGGKGGQDPQTAYAVVSWKDEERRVTPDA